MLCNIFVSKHDSFNGKGVKIIKKLPNYWIKFDGILENSLKPVQFQKIHLKSYKFKIRYDS